jgi:hypothetical protein
VIKIEEPATSWSGNLTITFGVSSVWKGDIGQKVVVSTASNDAQCGYPFTLCEDYLVYAYGFDGGVANVGLCGRTAPLRDADEDVVALGDPVTTWSVTSVLPVSWGQAKVGGLVP